MEVIHSVILIFNLFKTATECYGVFSDAAVASKDTKTLYWKLRIEEARFILWGRSWEFSQSSIYSPQLEEQLNSSAELAEIFRGVLAQIIDTLTNTEMLESRFGLKAVDLTLQPRTDTFASFKIIESFLYPWKSTTVNDRDFEQSLSLIKKLRWSINNKSAFTLLIEDLKDFNDRLFALLPPTTRASLDRALPSEILSYMEEVKELHTIEEVASEGYPRLQETAGLKSLKLIIEEIKPWITHGNAKQSLELIPNSIRFAKNFSSPASNDSYTTHPRIIGSYYPSRTSPESVDVLIEWKPYDSMPTNITQQMFSCIDDLARLLHVKSKPTDVRLLECLGWFDDTTCPNNPRIGFVYRLPLLQSPSPPVDTTPESANPPVSLYTLLGESKLPPLGDRFSLARALSRAILQLHSAGWLHKDFCSYNVLFFPKYHKTSPTPTLRITYRQLSLPYLSGFEYARPNAPNEVSESMNSHPEHPANLYWHPGYMQTPPTDSVASNPTKRPRFRQAYDTYALGCVLLEIGLWCRLDSLWQDKYTPKVWQDRLLNGWAKELGGKCGATYQRVVEECLAAEEKGDWGEGEALKAFVWGVVDELEKLRV